MTIDESGSILSDISYDKTDDSLVSISLLQVRTWMYEKKPFNFETFFLNFIFITLFQRSRHNGAK